MHNTTSRKIFNINLPIQQQMIERLDGYLALWILAPPRNS